MSDDSGWKNPRLREDMQFSLVEGGPVNYVHKTEKPVEHVTVAKSGGEVLGYLWACDADDAAGFQGRPPAGYIADNAGVYWTLKLREKKARGISPSQALAEFAADPDAGGEYVGQIVAGSRTQASSLAALKELAGDTERKKPGSPPPSRGRQVRRGFDA